MSTGRTRKQEQEHRERACLSKVKYNSMAQALAATNGERYAYKCQYSERDDIHFHVAEKKRAAIEWEPELPYINPYDRQVSQIMRIREIVRKAWRAGKTPTISVKPDNVSGIAWMFWRSCLRKAAYATQAEAEQFMIGCRAYQCGFCEQWHQTKTGAVPLDELSWRATGDKCELLRNGVVIASENHVQSRDDAPRKVAAEVETDSTSQWEQLVSETMRFCEEHCFDEL